MATHGPIGLFGKVPALGDFLRVQVADPVAHAFAGFLEEGVDALKRARAALTATPVRFFYRTPGERTALVGAFAPSSDRVGRGFPLAVFVPVEARALGPHFQAVPALYRPFLEAAASLVVEAASLQLPTLSQRLARLPLPDPAGFAAAANRELRALAMERVGDWQRRVFGSLESGARYYAFNAFRLSCQPLRGREPERSGVALDCPAPGEPEVSAWLELARRSLRWDVPPPFFWCGGANPRLLIALGPASTALLGSLAEPPQPNAKVWPLAVDGPQAVAAATQTLGSLRAVIDRPDATLEELFTAVSA